MTLLEAAKATLVALHRTVPHPWEAQLVEASRALCAALSGAGRLPDEARHSRYCANLPRERTDDNG